MVIWDTASGTFLMSSSLGLTKERSDTTENLLLRWKEIIKVKAVDDMMHCCPKRISALGYPYHQRSDSLDLH